MAETNKNKSVQPFGMKDKLGYMFGDFGNDFTFILSSSYLLKFYTDVMGVDAWIVGVIMMLARIVDAFTDVTMGRICDRSKQTPAGKFKPWIRRMCGPVAIASFLIYQSGLAGMPMAFKVGYLFVTYILWGSIFYTSINIPYGSMASAISAEPADRQSLSTFRTVGSTLAGLVIGVTVPMLAYTTDAAGNSVMSGSRFTVIAGVFSICAVLCYLVCYSLTTERVKPEVTAKEQPSVAEMLNNMFHNRALLSIIAASIVMLLAQLTMQAMNNYVYPNYYGDTTAQSMSSIVMIIGMLAAGAFAKPVSNKIGKAELGAVSSILAMAICLVLFAWRPANVWVYVAMQTLLWMGLGMYSMVSWALITDVIDYSEIKYGVREDGTTYALYSFARKLGQAASSGFTGALLSLIGYTEATAFEQSVKDGILNIATLVPAIGFGLLALVLALWYPLHKKQVDENVEILKRKHSGK